MDWLWNLLLEVTWQQVAWGVGLFLATFFGSLAVVALLLIKLPAKFFLDSHDRGFWIDRHPTVRYSGIALKNLLGIALIVLGIALSLPGVPGQGLLTILIGLVLIDFPGKRRLERFIVGRPKVLHAIDQLRARFGQEPLILDEPEPPVPKPAIENSEHNSRVS